MRVLVQYVLLAWLINCARGLIIEDNKHYSRVFDHTTATFGKQQPYNVSGELIFVEEVAPSNPKACSGFDMSTKAKLQGAVALVSAYSSGDCPYVIKAINVQNAGARAVIIGGTAANGHLVKMGCSSDCDNVTIPSIYITDTTVVSIQQLPAPRTAILDSTGETNPNSSTPAQKLTFFLVVLLIIPIAWCIMVAITLIFKVCSRLASRQIRRQEMRQLPDIPYTLIEEQNDEEKGKSNEDVKSSHTAPINDTCVICLEEFTAGMQIKILPCKHGFHGECIDPWLSERSDQCPICKQSVMVDPDRRIFLCIPWERCRACCAANNGNLSPRVTQMIMLLVVAFLAIIVALFFLYPT